MGRYRIVKCTPEILISLCKNDRVSLDDVRVIQNALPDDARPVRCVANTNINSALEISVVVESAEFDDVPEGEKIPLHPEVVFERRTKENS